MTQDRHEYPRPAQLGVAEHLQGSWGNLRCVGAHLSHAPRIPSFAAHSSHRSDRSTRASSCRGASRATCAAPDRRGSRVLSSWASETAGTLLPAIVTACSLRACEPCILTWRRVLQTQRSDGLSCMASHLHALQGGQGDAPDGYGRSAARAAAVSAIESVRSAGSRSGRVRGTCANGRSGWRRRVARARALHSSGCVQSSTC